MEKTLNQQEAKKVLYKIDLQIFGDNDDEDDNLPIDDADADNADDAEVEQDNDNQDDGNEDPYRKKIEVLEQLNSINTEKYETIEAEITETKTQIEQVNQMLNKIVGALNVQDSDDENDSKNKKSKKPTKINIDPIQQRKDDILIKKIKDLEAREKSRLEQDFINEQIADKPWLKEIVKIQKITTKDKYIESIMPMEDFYKKAYDNDKRLSENAERDIVDEYGFNPAGRVISKNDKKMKEVQQLGEDIISDILF
jgi:hypothetical protein